jgi:YVTN family beta-propeller protein
VKTSSTRTIALAAAVLLLAGAGAADTLIVLNKSDHTASIFDTAGGPARATVAVGRGPHEVEVLADGKTAAVSNYGLRGEPGRSLTLIDLEKGAAKGTVELGEGTKPHGLEALADGRLLVTAEGTRELLVVDTAAARVAARIPTSAEVSHMVVATPDGTRAFVANIGSGSVTAIDLAGRKVLKQIPTGEGAEGIDVTPDGREVWVTNREADTVSIVDPRTLQVTATVKAPAFPIRIKITPDGKRALVSCAKSGDVAVFDVASRKEVGRISLDREAVAGSSDRLFSTQFGKSPVPVGLLIAPDGKRAWVASTNADVVTLLDLERLAVHSRITPGKEPDGLGGAFGKTRN